jgi:hypothetical protein
MLAEVLLTRDPRSVSDISAPAPVAPTVVLAAVLLRRARPTLNPVVSTPVYQILAVTQMLYLGSRLRFVVFADRVELQWKEDDGVTWTVQSTWGSSAYPES